MEMYSIVDFLDSNERSRCGYCKSNKSSLSNGMWAHSLSPLAYQNLIDRGWRRSGKYLYKPTNGSTCCPLYTIRCNALQFQISKSQKKVIKKIDRLVLEGPKPSNIPPQPDPEPQPPSTMVKQLVALPTERPNIDPLVKQVALPAERSNIDPPSQGPPKPHPLKKREMRRERHRLKHAAAPPPLPTSVQSVTLETLMASVSNLTMKLVKVGSPEFEAGFKKEQELYTKYQVRVHGDQEKDVGEKQFRRFLCDNPFECLDGEGTHHVLYSTGSGRLVGVSVVDLLPRCISSVYFFYDTDFSRLSLGTFSAIHEIQLVRELNGSRPPLEYYYLGFYIHNCTKMKYKGAFAPSFLLCEGDHSWHPLQLLTPRLDKHKFFLFSGRSQPSQDPNQVQILYENEITDFEGYKRKRRISEAEGKQIQTYVDLVGEQTAQLLVLYRN